MVLGGTSDLVFRPGRKQTFTFLFIDSIASINSAIMESPKTKVVPFCVLHLIYWGGGREGSFWDRCADVFGVMVSWMLLILLLTLVWFLLLLLLIFLLLVEVVWLLSLLVQIFCFSVLFSFKSDSHLPKKNWFICFIESP